WVHPGSPWDGKARRTPGARRLADRLVPHQQTAGLRADSARPVDPEAGLHRALLLAERGERSDTAAGAPSRARGREVTIWLSATARAPTTRGLEGEHQTRLSPLPA